VQQSGVKLVDDPGGRGVAGTRDGSDQRDRQDQ
jgi:hypothetical protein